MCVYIHTLANHIIKLPVLVRCNESNEEATECMFKTQVQAQLPFERMNLSQNLQTALSGAAFNIVFFMALP